ncbi:hypothetical protein ColKHC_02674 [Colletotrichum higginsianum]|nr:hypothetical protein ColKHC_02674 [Colletotrichum higginsianum]
MFLAHAMLLASFPRLRSWYPPVRERSVLPRIRRFHVRVRLDCDPTFDAGAATAAFSGVEELVVEVWQAVFQGPTMTRCGCSRASAASRTSRSTGALGV